MKRFYFLLLLGVILTSSCSDQFAVTGTTNVQALEGKMLYLRVFRDDDMKAIDSSRVVHGKFKFGGLLDSSTMANVFFENTSVMPLVIEGGEVSLKIEEAIQSATGTPLNDSLSSFIHKKTQIDARMGELPRMESQMIMNGMDHESVLVELGAQARLLESENDQLITRFIKSNYNNVLGPGVFMIMTSSFPYPVLTPQIDDIVSQAPPYFLGHPYVKGYLKAAESNMEKLRAY